MEHAVNRVLDFYNSGRHEHTRLTTLVNCEAITQKISPAQLMAACRERLGALAPSRLAR